MEPATMEPAAITVHATQGSLTTATKDLSALVRAQQHSTFFSTSAAEPMFIQ